jgi:hypothetical protein
MYQNSLQIEGSRGVVAVGALLAMFLCSAAAKAEGNNLGYGSGGRLTDYHGIVDQYNASGERFRIRGQCQSACTMFLAIKNVCIERSARLRFHAGSNPLATARMKGHYNARLQGYLEVGDHMGTRVFHTISGNEMISRFGYRECPARSKRP